MKSKLTVRLLFAALTALTAVALIAPAAQAKEPAPGYENFYGCPTKEENPAVITCNRSIITGGHFQMGSKDVPIVNQIELNGGLAAGGLVVSNAKGGLKPVKQPVPGGIIGLTGLDWLVNFLNVEQLKLYAVTELAGQPILSSSFSLPIKVHLINPALGNNCYVGSTANPIALKMITGTTNPPPPNEPITGTPPKFSTEAKGIIHQDNGVFVDNSFAAPAASGCTLNIAFIPVNIDGLVNAESGLPSPAGTNETTQNFDLETVAYKKVYP
jgi:hypothetical protein